MKVLRAHEYLSPGPKVTGYKAGRPVMRHLRMEQREPGDPKFLYQHWDPRAWSGHGSAADRPVMGSPGWVWGKPEWADSLLYGLDRLQTIDPAQSLSWRLYWTEGERDADSINGLNIPHVVAVSHHGGARKATPAQAAYLRGWLGWAVVCADIDGAGAACALARFDLLRGIGIPTRSLRIVRPFGPTTREFRGRDVTDHLRTDGYSLDSLADVPIGPLRNRVSRMPPAQKRDGSGWKPDPLMGMVRRGEITRDEAAEIRANPLSTWRPIVQKRQPS